MSDTKFLKRLFQAYYQERKKQIPLINQFEQREYGFIPWDKQIMIRHTAFSDNDDLRDFLIKQGPRHTYFSGSLYKHPDNPDMENKDYIGCDLIFDIDVDHFYTNCKDDHDIYYCKECGYSGKGMIDNCPKCGKSKIKTQTWICEDCLNIAKNEIIKLIYNFLIPDFGIEENEMQVAFSGHRGYHLKIDNEKRTRF